MIFSIKTWAKFQCLILLFSSVGASEFTVNGDKDSLPQSRLHSSQTSSEFLVAERCDVYVRIVYDLKPSGMVHNAEIVESHPLGVFDHAAMEELKSDHPRTLESANEADIKNNE